MIKRNRKKIMFTLALTAGLVMTVAMFVGQPEVIAQERPMQFEPQLEAANESDADLKVGTYNSQTAFQEYPLQAELMEKLASLRQDMQEAQNEEDQQKVIQLQQEYEQERVQVIEKFQNDINQALPEVAEDADVKVIAEQVDYTADDVTTTDVTPQLVDAMAEQDDAEEQTPAEPQFQFQNQQ